MSAGTDGWRRLGRVLVEAGLLSEADLTEALTEQERSGELLGTILVVRGVLSPAAIANALAEQYGDVLRSELGFGTGLRASLVTAGDRRETEPEPPPLSRPEPAVRADMPSELEAAHLLFVPTSQGYLLLERDGPAPTAGERVELPDATQTTLTVVKVTASPLPADRRRCAYLQSL